MSKRFTLPLLSAHLGLGRLEKGGPSPAPKTAPAAEPTVEPGRSSSRRALPPARRRSSRLALLSLLALQLGACSPSSPSEKTVAIVRAMPKVELHCHLDGSVRPETARALYQEVHKDALSADGLKQRYQLLTPQSTWDGFNARFEFIIPLLRSSEALGRVMYELLEDAQREGVIYIEIRFAPAPLVMGDFGVREAVSAVLDGRERAQRVLQIRSGVILSMHTQDAEELQRQVLAAAAANMSRGVVGIDYYGELTAPENRGVFERAKQFCAAHGLQVTAHAGEISGPGSIAFMTQVLGARRIGHGLVLREDPALYGAVKESGITLEMCPTSNVRMRAVPGYGAHPLRGYFKDGLLVTVNSDDRGVFATSLTDEYLHVVADMGLSVDDLVTMNRYAIDAAFLDEAARSSLRDEFRRKLEALNLPASR